MSSPWLESLILPGLRLTVAGALCASVLYTVFSLWCMLRFPFSQGGAGSRHRARLRRRVTWSAEEDVEPAWPSVSVLRPIFGLGGEPAQRAQRRRLLEECLASLFLQDYPDYEVVFGFQEIDDAALPLVEEVRARYPHVPSRVVKVPDAPGPNRKASVLAALEKVARHDVLVVSDQDMFVGPCYLKSVMASFETPDTGVVTCAYRTRRVPDVGGILEALAVNVDFIPSAIVARALGGLNFAMGATMAVTRVALASMGGFAALQPYLADDYQLGNRVFRNGRRIALSPYLVDNLLPPSGFGAYFNHQLRWARTYRVCQPVGYFFSFVMHGTVLALLLLALLGFSETGFLVLSAWLCLRLGVALVNMSRLTGEVSQAPWLLVLPFKDVLNFVIWLLAFTGDTVSWGGRTFVVRPDGRMREAR